MENVEHALEGIDDDDDNDSDGSDGAVRKTEGGGGFSDPQFWGFGCQSRRFDSQALGIRVDVVLFHFVRSLQRSSNAKRPSGMVAYKPY